MSDVGGLYGRDELRSLIRSDSIFDGVFDCLRRVWSEPEAFADRNLDDSEYRTRLLERELTRLHPELYADLREQIESEDHPLMELDSGCGVIMDALSLREGSRLEHELPVDHEWDVSLSWAPIERLPSATKFICQAWFGGNGPAAVNRDDFRFLGGMDVPQLPGTDPEYVWTRMPDPRLEEAMKGNYSTEEIEEIYGDTKSLLETIINESVHEEFLVTSDHGYVNHLGNSPYSLREELEDALASKFSGRYGEIGNSQAYQLLERADIIERVSEHYVIRGHYNRTKPGASKKISHGGFSLPESMTPVLRINTNPEGGS